MALRYLLDENQRGTLWHVIQRHNARGIDPIDAVRVGDVPDLPLGSDDPEILRWAEREQRILVTFDKSSIGPHLSAHLAAGNHCPGIFMVSTHSNAVRIIEFLVLAAHASAPEEWRDWIKYLQ